MVLHGGANERPNAATDRREPDQAADDVREVGWLRHRNPSCPRTMNLGTGRHAEPVSPETNHAPPSTASRCSDSGLPDGWRPLRRLSSTPAKAPPTTPVTTPAAHQPAGSTKKPPKNPSAPAAEARPNTGKSTVAHPFACGESAICVSWRRTCF